MGFGLRMRSTLSSLFDQLLLLGKLPGPCLGREEYSDRLVGFPSRQRIEQFQEAHGGFTIWLDPFGVLDPQVVVDLLPAPGVVDERSCLKRTKWPSEGLPK